MFKIRQFKGCSKQSVNSEFKMLKREFHFAGSSSVHTEALQCTVVVAELIGALLRTSG